MDEPFCVISNESVVFQTGFGLKQDWPGHCFLVIRLCVAPEEELCPINHVRAYIRVTEPLRSSRSFFVTTVPPHGKAAKITLKQWFAKVLQEARVDVSPSLTRAAVASTVLSKEVVVDTFMQAADWSSACTLFSHYLRLLPSESLGEGTSQSVQSALLDH